MIPAIGDKLPVVGGLPARRLELRVAFALPVRGLAFAAAMRAELLAVILWVMACRCTVSVQRRITGSGQSSEVFRWPLLNVPKCCLGRFACVCCSQVGKALARVGKSSKWWQAFANVCSQADCMYPPWDNNTKGGLLSENCWKLRIPTIR